MLCHLLIFFKINILKNSFGTTITVSNSLDPDQARRIVGPDLGPNCLQRLSADDTNRVKTSEHRWCLYKVQMKLHRLIGESSN